MSDTRQAWKPWRANTRTAASRISRRLSRAFVRGWGAGGGRGGHSYRRLHRPAVCLRAAVGERRQARSNLALVLEVEVGDDVALAVRRLRQHYPPRVDDHRAPT